MLVVMPREASKLPLEIFISTLYNRIREFLPGEVVNVLSVYNPTGSGNVHTDKVISGGRQKVAKGMGFKAAAASAAKKSGKPMQQAQAMIAAGARGASPAAKKANPALKKVGAKKANPFAKTMSAPATAACPPGSMSGGMGTSKGIGAAKKATKKAVPKAMGEVGIKTSRQRRAEASDAVRKTAKSSLPSQNRIKGYPDKAGKGVPTSPRGSLRTSGSDVN
jgi:hypothetical protein